MASSSSFGAPVARVSPGPFEELDIVASEDEGDAFMLSELDFDFHSAHLASHQQLQLDEEKSQQVDLKEVTLRSSSTPERKPVRLVLRQGADVPEKNIIGQGIGSSTATGEADASATSATVQLLKIPESEMDCSPIIIPEQVGIGGSTNQVPPGAVPPSFPCSLPLSFIASSAFSTTIQPNRNSGALFGKQSSALMGSHNNLTRPKDLSVVDYHPPFSPGEPALRDPFTIFEEESRSLVGVNLVQLTFGGFSFANNDEDDSSGSLVSKCIHSLVTYLEQKEKEQGKIPKLEGLNEDLLVRVLERIKSIAPRLQKACFTSALTEVSPARFSQFGASISEIDVLAEVAEHCPHLQRLSWGLSGCNVQPGMLRALLRNCKQLTHLLLFANAAIPCQNLQLDLAAFAPQLQTLHLSDCDFVVRLGFLLEHCNNLDQVWLSRCKLAGKCKAKSERLATLALTSCVVGELSIDCPALRAISFNSCCLKAGMPSLVNCGKIEKLNVKIEEGLPSAQEVLVWLADKNFDSLQETTIVCKWSAQQFGGLLSRLNACSQLQALAIGPPQSNPTEDSNGGLSPDLRSLCLSLANLKTLTFYCPFKWKPADITLRLPSLAHLELAAEAANYGIRSSELVQILAQTGSTLRKCILIVQPWEQNQAREWFSLRLPVLEEVFVKVGNPAEAGRSPSPVDDDYPAAFLHAAPALKKFAFKGLRRGSDLQFGGAPRFQFPGQQTFAFGGGGGGGGGLFSAAPANMFRTGASSLFASSLPGSPPILEDDPAEEEEAKSASTVVFRPEWSVNCQALNQLVLHTPTLPKERTNEIIAQCPELQTVILSAESAFGLFGGSQPSGEEVCLTMPTSCRVKNLRLKEMALHPQTRIQSQTLVTLNLTNCRLDAIVEAHQFVGTKPCEFFECIAQGCPALRNLIFSWDSQRQNVGLFGVAAEAPKITGHQLPVLPFPDLEILSINTQPATVTNGDLLQIATNCYNLRTFIIASNSGIFSRYADVPLEAIKEVEDEMHPVDNDDEEEETGGAVSMPHLEFLNLQSTVCTDGVLKSLVRGAPKLRVLVATMSAALVSPHIVHERLEELSLSMSKQVGLDTWAKTQIKCPRLRLFHLNDTHLSKEALERITGACPNLQHLVATAVPSLFSAPSRPTEKRIYGGDDDLSRASRLMELTSHGDPAHEEMFRTREHEDKKGKGKLVEEDNEDEGSQQMIPKDLPTAKLECPRMKNLRLSVDPYTPHQPMVPSKLLLRAPDLQILVAEGVPLLDENVQVILQECPDLQDINLSKCMELNNVDLSMGKKLKQVSFAYSTIKILEISRKNNPELVSVDFDNCPLLERVHLDLKALGSSEQHVINKCPELRELEISCDHLDRLDVTHCPSLETVVVRTEKPFSLTMTECGIRSDGLQRLVNECPSVAEISVAACGLLAKLKLNLPPHCTLKNLILNECTKLTSAKVTGPSLETLGLLNNVRLVKLHIDCENLRELLPEDIFGLNPLHLWAPDYTSKLSGFAVESDGLEDVRVRSKKLPNLRLGGLGSLQRLDVCCEGLKQIMLKDVDPSRFGDDDDDDDQDNAEVDSDGALVEKLLKENKKVEVVCLVNVAMGDKQNFDSENLQLLACSSIPTPTSFLVRPRQRETENNSALAKALSKGQQDRDQVHVQQTSDLGQGSAEEVTIRSAKLQVLFLTGLMNLRKITFTAEQVQHLDWVDLSGCVELRDETIDQLTSHCGNVRKLILRGCARLTDKMTPALNKLSSSLIILDLTRTRIRRPRLELEELKHLDLSGCTRLKSCTLGCGKLQGLVLDGTGDLEATLGGLKSPECLRFLWAKNLSTRQSKDKSPVKISDKGKERADEPASKNDLGLKNLEVLDISGSKFHLVQCLVSGSRKLQCLVARSSKGYDTLEIQDLHMGLLALSRSQSLRVLHLRNIQIDTIDLTSCPRLEEVVIESPSLRNLVLQECSNLARVQLNTPSLSDLSLCGGRVDVAAVVRALVHNRTDRVHIATDNEHRMTQQEIQTLTAGLPPGISCNIPPSKHLRQHGETGLHP